VGFCDDGDEPSVSVTRENLLSSLITVDYTMELASFVQESQSSSNVRCIKFCGLFYVQKPKFPSKEVTVLEYS
jgi:hypothetical protein